MLSSNNTLAQNSGKEEEIFNDQASTTSSIADFNQQLETVTSIIQTLPNEQSIRTDEFNNFFIVPEDKKQQTVLPEDIVYIGKQLLLLASHPQASLEVIEEITGLENALPSLSRSAPQFYARFLFRVNSLARGRELTGILKTAFDKYILQALVIAASFKSILNSLTLTEELIDSFVLDYLKMSFSNNLIGSYLEKFPNSLLLAAVDETGKINIPQLSPETVHPVFFMITAFDKSQWSISNDLKNRFYGRLMTLVPLYRAKVQDTNLADKEMLDFYQGDQYRNSKLMQQHYSDAIDRNFALTLYAYIPSYPLENKIKHTSLDPYIEFMQTPSVTDSQFATNRDSPLMCILTFKDDTFLPNNILLAALEKRSKELAEDKKARQNYELNEALKKIAAIAAHGYRHHHHRLETIVNVKEYFKVDCGNLLAALSKYFAGKFSPSYVFRTLFYQAVQKLATDGKKLSVDYLITEVIPSVLEQQEMIEKSFTQLVSQMNAAGSTPRLKPALLQDEQKILASHLSCLFAEKYKTIPSPEFLASLLEKLVHSLNSRAPTTINSNTNTSGNLFYSPAKFEKYKLKPQTSAVVPDFSLAVVNDDPKKNKITLTQKDLETWMEEAFQETCNPVVRFWS